MGARVTISEDGTVRVRDAPGDPFPVILEGPYLSDTTAVYLVGASSGKRVNVPQTEASGASSFAVLWPGSLPDDFARLHVRDPEREAGGAKIPVMTLEAPDNVRAGASHLSWASEPEHGLYSVVMLSGATASDRKLVLTPDCHVRWDELDDNGEYRAVIREHDGREIVRSIAEVRLQRHDGAFPSAVNAVAPSLVELRDALMSGDRKATVPEGILEISRQADGPALADELGRLLTDLFEFRAGFNHRGNPFNFPEITQLAERASARSEGSRLVSEFLSYLALHGVVDLQFRRLRLRDRTYLADFFSIYDCFSLENGEQLLDRLAHSPVHSSGSYASLMVDALSTSLIDRERAAALFAQAREADRTMWDHMPVDVGAGGYVSHEQVERHKATAQPELLTRLELLSAMPTWSAGVYMYVCSGTPLEFRVYFPFWLAIAEYVKSRRLSFHFVLTGSAVETSELYEAADDLRRQMGILRGFDPDTFADNISFSSVSPPAHLERLDAFHGCARLLFARRLAREYEGPLVISRLDVFFREDPRRYLSSLDWDKIGVDARNGFEAIKPWRRFAADTVLLPFGDLPLRRFEPVEDYLLCALMLERPADLNENALAYWFERIMALDGRELVGGLGRVRSPAVHEEIGALLKRQQARLDEFSALTAPWA